MTHVGDDTSIQVLLTDLRTRPLTPNQHHWFKRIMKGTKDGWEKATKKWPQPWMSWRGIIEEGQGWLLLPGEQKVPVHFALWQERATSLTESSSWGGTMQTSEDRVFLSTEEITLRLADERQGKALIQTSISKGNITIIGQGPYPE